MNKYDINRMSRTLKDDIQEKVNFIDTLYLRRPVKLFASRLLLIMSVYCLTFIGSPTVASAQQVEFENGVVASVNPIASDAGLAAMKTGGNAVDAAIATALTLGVVDGHNSGIGGGCFILIRTAKGEIIAIDGREMAPAKAHRDMYIKDGKPDTSISQTGPLASGIPGAIAAYEMALKKAGRKSLKELILPAAKIAEEGFAVDRVLAGRIAATREKISKFEGTRRVLLKENGEPYKSGELLRQTDLAKTFRSIGNQGTDWFYKGEFAKVVAEWMSKNGGIITAKDFENYQPIERKAIQTTYRGNTIVGFPPPSSGGVHVAQILNILEQFEISKLREKDEVAYTHLVVEAMKLAFADRAYWLGDPDFAKVPKGLIEKDYAKMLAKKIDMKRSTKVTSHGTPPSSDTNLFGNRHTTHIAAADKMGNWVAITQTVNTSFGSKVIVPGTGVILNNEMDDFAVAPGVPNAFGLLGAEANSVRPGKRPLSSMSPTIVLRDGKPVMSVGAAGGPKIITQSLLCTLRFLDHQMSIREALKTPRFHHQWTPDAVLLEKAANAKLELGLKKLGHKIKRSSVVGVSQAVSVTKNGKLTGVHDPRVPGKVAGY